VPAKRSRRQIERLKKARSAKTGRFVVVHARSGAIRSVVRDKGAGRAVPKAKTYSTIVAGGSRRGSVDPDARRGREADEVAEPIGGKGFSGRPKILDLLGAGGLDEEEARVYAREVVRIVRGGSRDPEAPAPSPEAVRERREARQHREG
jgi:hypothetical protein